MLDFVAIFSIFDSVITNFVCSFPLMTAKGFLGVQPISGVSKERDTLWSGCIGLKALAGFLGQRPKPLGRAHNYASEACSYSGL